MTGVHAAYIAYGIEGLFYLTTLIFVIVTLFLAYHWFTYGSKRHISMLALTIYLIGSAPLFMIMAISLYLL